MTQSDLLPPAFQFSQNSLQDYVDCARRFQLRYVIDQKWPAAESEPIDRHEHFLEQGSKFHLLVQRHLSGIPTEALTPHDPLLAGWWQDYLRHPIADLPETVRLPELNLSTPVAGQRLTATFDLLALEPGQRAVIVDWKTSQRLPHRDTLAARLQTRVYPFVLVEAGTHLFGGPIAPEQAAMIYWYANYPTQPQRFPYDAAQHAANREYLSGLIESILAHDEEEWPLTEDERRCKYCVYRSLCDRGVEAGPFGEWDEDVLDIDPEAVADFDFDLDNVEEIAF
jgi:hypothetical protein